MIKNRSPVRRRALSAALSAALAMGMLAGCGAQADMPVPTPVPSPDILVQDFDSLEEQDIQDVLDGEVPTAGSPAMMQGVVPVASGTDVMSAPDCEIDYSNVADGYFMARWTGGSNKIKLQSTGPGGTTYTYNLRSDGEWEAFPFSDGNGSYSVRVMRNTSGTKYAVSAKTDIQADMTDAFRPFLTSNQYVDFGSSTKACDLAVQLCSGKADTLDKVAAVYDWTVDNLTYDTEKAQSVKSGYLPVLDSVIDTKTGICFDYAALMSGMLRSQGVACKLVVGYAGQAYHAWISVWVEGQGWVDGAIYFDGTSWQRMDPTFASSSSRDENVMKYIGDGSNYTEKYVY